MKVSIQQVAIPNSNGTTFNITDAQISSDWKGAILFEGNPTANATTTAGSQIVIGAVDAGGRNVCLGTGGADATSGGTTSVYLSNANCIQLLTNAGGLGPGATYSATLSNGVTLITNNNASGAHLLNALMFSGADIEFAVSSAHQVSGSGTSTIGHNLTGTPDCVVVLCSNANVNLPGGGAGAASIGFFDGTSPIGFSGAIVNAANPTNVAAMCGTANVGEFLSQTPADTGTWTLSFVGPSSLTVTRSVTANSANVAVISWRHLYNSAAARAFLNTTPAATGNNVIATGLSPGPQLWLNVSTRLPTTAFTNSDAAGSWGFAAGVNNAGTTQQGAIGSSFEYNVSASSVAKSYINLASASLTLTDTGTLNFASTVNSWDIQGATENVGTTDGNTYQRINLLYGCTPPIASQPGSLTINSGNSAYFSVTAANFGGSPSYQWQDNRSGSFANTTDGTGATSAYHTTPTLTTGATGRQYQCIVTDSVNGATTSHAATVTVLAAYNTTIAGFDPELTVRGWFG